MLLNDTDTNISDLEETLEQLNETSVELRKSDAQIKKLVQEEHLEETEFEIFGHECIISNRTK